MASAAAPQLTTAEAEALTSYCRPRGADGDFVPNPPGNAPGHPSTARDGSELSVRVYLPPAGVKPYARLFFVVGAGATLGDPKHEAVLFQPLAAHGLVVIAHDHYGHGASAGEPRGAVTSFELLVADLVSVATTYSTSDRLVDALPFFVSGESLGGLVSLLAGLAITDSKSQQSEPFPVGGAPAGAGARFAGVVTLSPALDSLATDVPSWLVSGLYCVTGRNPATKLPEDKKADLSVLSPHAEDQSFFRWAPQHGVFYTICFGTLRAIIGASHALRRALPRITFPFVLIQDPNEQVVHPTGMSTILDLSATPVERKRRVEVTADDASAHAASKAAADDSGSPPAGAPEVKEVSSWRRARPKKQGAHIPLLAYPVQVVNSVLEWTHAEVRLQTAQQSASLI